MKGETSNSWMWISLLRGKVIGEGDRSLETNSANSVDAVEMMKWCAKNLTTLFLRGATMKTTSLNISLLNRAARLRMEGSLEKSFLRYRMVSLSGGNPSNKGCPARTLIAILEGVCSHQRHHQDQQRVFLSFFLSLFELVIHRENIRDCRDGAFFHFFYHANKRERREIQDQKEHMMSRNSAVNPSRSTTVFFCNSN